MKKYILSLSATFLLIVGVTNSYATLIVNATEVSGDVVFSGGGTADLTGLTFSSNVSHADGSISNFPRFFFGNGLDQIFSGASGPSNYGSGGTTIASSSTGDRFGIASATDILLPTGYVSGSALFGTMTFLGKTFATMGLTPGTYDWTWGTGVNADLFRLQVGAVPEPTTIVLMGLGLTGIVYARRRKKKRG